MRKNAEPLSDRLRSVAIKNLGLITVLLAVIIIFSSLNPAFLTTRTMLGIAKTICEIGLIALPMTFIVIIGGMDLSVSAIMGLTAVCFGMTFTATGSMALSILAAALTGMAAGALNGFFVSRTRTPPMVITLATMYLFQGVAIGVSGGVQYRGFPDWFFTLGMGKVAGIPVPFLLFIGGAVIAELVLKKTYAGRCVYALGNNENAAYYAGMNVRRTKFLVYLSSGLLSAVAALIYIARLSTAKADAGDGFSFDIFTAVFLGGASFTGGSGAVTGTVLGVIIIGMIRNGMIAIGMPTEITKFVIGALLIISVVYNDLIAKKLVKR